MEHTNIQYNKKGYQTVFQCSECGKYFDLEDLRYFGDHRVCTNCLNNFQKTQKEEARKIEVHFSAEGLDDENEIEDYTEEY